VNEYTAGTRSARGQAIKHLEKKAFFQGVTCPACHEKIPVIRDGKRLLVPDAKSIVDNGCCRKCRELEATT